MWTSTFPVVVDNHGFCFLQVWCPTVFASSGHHVLLNLVLTTRPFSSKELDHTFIIKLLPRSCCHFNFGLTCDHFCAPPPLRFFALNGLILSLNYLWTCLLHLHGHMKNNLVSLTWLVLVWLWWGYIKYITTASSTPGSTIFNEYFMKWWRGKRVKIFDPTRDSSELMKCMQIQKWAHTDNGLGIRRNKAGLRLRQGNYRYR